MACYYSSTKKGTLFDNHCCHPHHVHYLCLHHQLKRDYHHHHQHILHHQHVHLERDYVTGTSPPWTCGRILRGKSGSRVGQETCNLPGDHNCQVRGHVGLYKWFGLSVMVVIRHITIWAGPLLPRLLPPCFHHYYHVGTVMTTIITKIVSIFFSTIISDYYHIINSRVI